MLILWDEPKRRSNLDKHGLDFAFLTEAFLAEAVVLPAKENRYMAIGKLDGETVVVVFATLGTEAISVVSMRLASKAESGSLP